jgi:hypothetical protein
MERTHGRRGALGVYGAAAIFLAVAVPVLFFQACGSDGTKAVGSKAAGETTATTTTPTTAPAVNEDEAAENVPDVKLDPATQAKLDADLAVARTVTKEYPTVAAATAAHLLQAGGFAPQLGAHYISYANVGREIRPDGSVDPRYPGGFIYTGNKPTSKIVGLMYISLGDKQPSGFPGPNDHWHRHHNLCIQYGRGPGGSIAVPFAPDRDVTREQCDGVRGTFMKQTVWMVHTWVVPGWASPKGVFSHEDPDLRCANGTILANAVGFCPGK